MTSYPLKYEHFLPKETASPPNPRFSVEEAQTSLCIGKQYCSQALTDEVSEQALQFSLPVHTMTFIMKSQRHMPEETG